ncbi:MAG: cobalamin-dependent protein, partial [Bdellovibrionales bacterium]|nr:cobalamin-dependent protein [Bdellovibrionales bacterium]
MEEALYLKNNRALKGARVVLVHQPRKGVLIPKINLVPLGLFALADLLDQCGARVEIIHTGVEEALDPRFSLLKELSQIDPILIGFTLAWHQQATQTIECIQRVKQTLSKSAIIVGGYTASRFARDILNTVPEIDFVIRGEAELPLVRLTAALLAQPSAQFERVPNLLWRQSDNTVRESERSYQADNAIINQISFTRFELMRNFEEYLKLKMNLDFSSTERSFYFSVGRGCSASCLYCGGSRRAFQKYYARKGVLVFEHDYVLAQLGNLSNHHISHWNSCFDPFPTSPYYPELFKKIRSKDLAMSHVFDCFGLPQSSFVEEFSQTFLPGSVLSLSPETGAEDLRKRLKTFYYSDKELFSAIENILE